MDDRRVLEVKTGQIRRQDDGAIVYTLRVGPNRYNLIVEADAGVVTAMKRKTSRELRALARKYGWH